MHDGNQFELKLDYALDAERAKNHYQVETYFFIPRSLGIEPHTYSREHFYADVQAYIRFKTPVVTLVSLADRANKASVLNHIEQVMNDSMSGPDQPPRDAVTHDLQLLGCLVRVRVRDVTNDLCSKIRRLEDHAQARRVLVEDVRTGILRLLHGIEELVSRYRSLRPLFMQTEQQPWVGELFERTDDYISTSIESYLTMLIAELDRHGRVRQFLGEPRTAVRDRVLAERQHRESAGYLSVLSVSGPNEAYVHRFGQLKKFMSSVLFLEIRKEQEGKRVGQIVAGLAAGIAMFFSTVAAVWSQSRYGLNSIPFVVAVVITYIFKDRIKEWLRTYFNNKLTRRLFDYNTTIVDPFSKTELGRCRESFTYLDPRKVPHQIVQQRHFDAAGVLEPESKPEVVLKYIKDVTILGKRVAASHGRTYDINDIIRFNITSFLPRMDDPVREVEVFDAERDLVTKVPCPKTYHINVIMVLRAQHQVASTLRFRVVLDKQGIRDLHEVRSVRLGTAVGHLPAPTGDVQPLIQRSLLEQRVAAQTVVAMRESETPPL